MIMIMLIIMVMIMTMSVTVIIIIIIVIIIICIITIIFITVITIIIIVVFVILQDVRVLSRNQRPDEERMPWCRVFNSTQYYCSVPQPVSCSCRRAFCKQY